MPRRTGRYPSKRKSKGGLYKTTVTSIGPLRTGNYFGFDEGSIPTRGRIVAMQVVKTAGSASDVAVRVYTEADRDSELLWDSASFAMPTRMGISNGAATASAYNLGGQESMSSIYIGAQPNSGSDTYISVSLIIDTGW